MNDNEDELLLAMATMSARLARRGGKSQRRYMEMWPPNLRAVALAAWAATAEDPPDSATSLGLLTGSEAEE